VTHVLLPAALLLRRCDLVEVIGRALELAGVGWGQRRIVAAVGVPRSTLRGWLTRFAERAEMLRAQFVGWAVAGVGCGGIEPSGSPVADAVTAIVAAAECARGEFADLGRWRFAAAATGGRLLCSTSAPFRSPWMA
jgi:Homeodomain-like domain